MAGLILSFLLLLFVLWEDHVQVAAILGLIHSSAKAQPKLLEFCKWRTYRWVLLRWWRQDSDLWAIFCGTKSCLSLFLSLSLSRARSAGVFSYPFKGSWGGAGVVAVMCQRAESEKQKQNGKKINKIKIKQTKTNERENKRSRHCPCKSAKRYLLHHRTR